MICYRADAGGYGLNGEWDESPVPACGRPADQPTTIYPDGGGEMANGQPWPALTCSRCRALRLDIGPVLTVNFGFHQTRLVVVDGETIGCLARRIDSGPGPWRFVRPNQDFRVAG